jgi:hypothetical protein
MFPMRFPSSQAGTIMPVPNRSSVVGSGTGATAVTTGGMRPGLETSSKPGKL